MDSPYKRRRLFTSETPDVELHKRRVHNDMKLKSRFEAIFEKYSKDFSGVGDIIDFEKDEIVVNNGHIANMLDEKDPGNDSEWSDDPDDPLSDDDIATRPMQEIIPDSQGLDSSDDDPLGMPEEVIPFANSSFHQWRAVSTSEGKTKRGRDGKANTARQTHAFSSPIRPLHPSASQKVHPPPIFQDKPFIERSWRFPPLPEDSNVQLALPSPSFSDQDESEPTRSVSPPGISIWAPVKNGVRSRRVESPGFPWTKNELELLRHYKTSTDLTFEDMCTHFPGRTNKALRQRWLSLNQQEPPLTHLLQRKSWNRWTPEEDQLLHNLKTTTNKTYAEIQRQIPRHPTSTIPYHWYRLREKLDQPLERVDVLVSDIPASPDHGKLPAEDIHYQQDDLDELSQLNSSQAFVESLSSGSHDGELSEKLVPLEDLEANPRLDDENAAQRKFPSDLVIPDSQGSEGTQHLARQSSDTQACVVGSIPLEKLGDKDHAFKDSFHLLPDLDASSYSENLKTCSIHCNHPPTSTTVHSQKCKHVADSDDNDRQGPSGPIQNLLALVEEEPPDASQSHWSSGQQIVKPGKPPNSEAASPKPCSLSEPCHQLERKLGVSCLEDSEPSDPDSSSLDAGKTHEPAIQTATDTPQGAITASMSLTLLNPAETTNITDDQPSSEATVESHDPQSPTTTTGAGSSQMELENSTGSINMEYECSKQINVVASLRQWFQCVEICNPSSTPLVSLAAASSIHEEEIEKDGLCLLPQPSEGQRVVDKSTIGNEDQKSKHCDPFRERTERDHCYSEQEAHYAFPEPQLLAASNEQKGVRCSNTTDTVDIAIGVDQGNFVPFNNNDLTAKDLSPKIPSFQQQRTSMEENEEDDLQMSYELTLTSKRKVTQQAGGASPYRPTFAASINDTNMSDDELSTPSKAAQKQVEMTPVRSVSGVRQGLSNNVSGFSVAF